VNAAAPRAESPARRRVAVSPRALAAAGVAAAAVALGAWLWARSGATEAPSYVTEAVDRGPVEVVVTATGTVNPVTTVTVGSYVSGPIREIYADYNSEVKRGQLVAKIDPRPY
jgi:HlyD family secretion protein